MSHVKSMATFVITGLEISGLDKNHFIQLYDVLTQKEIPVTRENIAKRKDLARSPYVQKVDILEIDGNIKLLIGTNASKIIEPWEIVNGQSEGPYAVKTLVG